MISGKILYILRLEHSAECSKRIFHRMGLPQDGAACLPPQALTRQIPLFVTCDDIFPRSGGSLSSRGRLCLVGKLSGIAISRPLGEGGLTRSGKTEGVTAGKASAVLEPETPPLCQKAPPSGELSPQVTERVGSLPEGAGFAQQRLREFSFHAKNSPCTVRCGGSLNLQLVTYSCTYPDSSSGSRRW